MMPGFTRYQTSAPARPTLWPPSFGLGQRIGESARRLGLTYAEAAAKMEASRKRGQRRARQANQVRRILSGGGCDAR